jgi:hypothetical protein
MPCLSCYTNPKLALIGGLRSLSFFRDAHVVFHAGQFVKEMRVHIRVLELVKKL